MNGENRPTTRTKLLIGAVGLVVAGVLLVPVTAAVVDSMPGCETQADRDTEALRSSIVRSEPMLLTEITSHSDCDSGGDPWLEFATPYGTSAATVTDQYMSAGWAPASYSSAELAGPDEETAVGVTKTLGGRRILMIITTKQGSGRVTGQMAFDS
ncbi:hypothetical protein [Planotetraspora mira]|uniref:Uncharacterized protein n=1 Tax=Planotetraspora mira TaxID=58121 RepID=A0A8J3TKP4_9ACTN|nr:hypothetical protein [Planotetraspora mira]GII27476.1 hypothetical protein Pmi06nite_09180 [Planotetraspora mira]